MFLTHTCLKVTLQILLVSLCFDPDLSPEVSCGVFLLASPCFRFQSIWDFRCLDFQFGVFVCTRCGCLDLLPVWLEPSSLSVHVLLLFLFCFVCFGTEYYNVVQCTLNLQCSSDCLKSMIPPPQVPSC